MIEVRTLDDFVYFLFDCISNNLDYRLYLSDHEEKIVFPNSPKTTTSFCFVLMTSIYQVNYQGYCKIIEFNKMLSVLKKIDCSYTFVKDLYVQNGIIYFKNKNGLL